MARVNQKLTITAGTPINLATGLTVAALSSDRKIVRSVNIQMIHGGTGRGILMAGIAIGRVPASSNVGDVTRELAPATASAPGGAWDETADAIDLSTYWLDGTNSGDTAFVSYDQKT